MKILYIQTFLLRGINLILQTVIWFVLYDLQWELKMINKLKKRAKRGQKNSIILHKTSNYSSQPPNHPITPMAATFYTYIYFVYILMIVTINIVMVFGVVWWPYVRRNSTQADQLNTHWKCSKLIKGIEHYW